jgi:tousled-like kinase
VWSVGVIFYQLLYGRRPFGDDMTQQQVVSKGIMLNARLDKFPDTPKVSSETQDFIRACLIPDHTQRSDVLGLCQSFQKYLSPKK